MKVAVVGAGAVGCFFGGMLARAGTPVTFIGRPAQTEALKRDGLTIESATVPAHISVTASSDNVAVVKADMILVCVKTLDLERAALDLAPLLADGQIVVCMQNGVDHGKRFEAAAGHQAVAAAVYVAAEMEGPTRVRHNGRGDLVVGAAPKDQLETVSKVFVEAGVPCRISENIEGELWVKLIMNCAYNAQSALTTARYGAITANAATRQALIDSVRECIAVADALGIVLPHPNPVEAALQLGTTMGQQHSSTAQDIARGKKTEIDSLNGYVVRRAAEVGVPTPVNQTLYALVKLREESPGF